MGVKMLRSKIVQGVKMLGSENVGSENVQGAKMYRE